MYAGRVVERAPAAALFAEPQHPYTIGLLGSIPRLDLEQRAALPRSKGPCPTPPRCRRAAASIRAARSRSRNAAATPAPYGSASRGTSPRAGGRRCERRCCAREHLVKHFRGGIRAVDDVSFEVYPGETLALVGESGCGKSTTGRLRAAPARADLGQGLVRRPGDLARSASARCARCGGEMQIIFQDPYGSLNPRMTVGDMLAEPLALHGACTKARQATGARAARPGRARAGARAAAIRTSSPAGSASASASRARSRSSRGSSSATSRCRRSTSRSRRRSSTCCRTCSSASGLAYVFIAHDLAVVRHIATRVAVMYLGKIVELADKRALFARAAPSVHAARCCLRSRCPTPPPSAAASVLQGDVPSPYAPPSGCRSIPAARTPASAAAPRSRALASAQGHATACHFWSEIAGPAARCRLTPANAATCYGYRQHLIREEDAMRILPRRSSCFSSLSTVQGQTLRIGLAEDPDILDPTMARTFVGRIVFAGLCDKLFDLDEKLNIVPQLATSYEWAADSKSLVIKLRRGVTFHDGEKLDAEAVKFNIERHMNMPGSIRSGEIGGRVERGRGRPSRVRINLSAPFAPLLAVLTDRAGMMVSPKAAQAAGDKFGARPVCAGPFRFVERVAQDRIVLERFPDYWDKGQIHFDRVVYLPIVDATVRLANLRSGQLDFIERLAPTDVPGLRSDSRFKIAGSSRSATRGSRSTSARATWRRRTRSARMRACARRSSCRSTATRSSRWRSTARRRPATSGSRRATATTARAPDAEARRGAREAAAQGGRRAQPDLHADDADRPRTRSARAGRPGDGEGGGLRHQDPVDRVRHLAQPRRQGPVRGLRARLERPRRPRRQPAHHARLQGADRTTPLLQRRRRRAHQQVAHVPDPAEREEAYDKSRSRCRRTARSCTCATATGCGRTAPSCAAFAPFRTAWCACRA